MLKRVLNFLIRKTLPFWQMVGFNITPVHFYSPLPEIKKLKKELWERKSDLIGIDMKEKEQVEMLDLFFNNFKKEYDVVSKMPVNSEFGAIDSEILYCMTRHLKPKKIIEIGSGYSTLIMIDAIKKNKIEKGVDCKLTSIDPYPKDFIEKQDDDFFTIIKKEVQDIPLEEFKSLSENDIVFIDSSHVLKIGSDVQYEYLEILPRLNKGVAVHIHDIFFPFEYPEKWVLKEKMFFNEQYLLQAFLTFNNHFEVLWSGSFMHYKYSELLSKYFSSYNLKESLPGSFWIKKVL